MNARNKALLYLIISVLLCFGCNVCQNERSGILQSTQELQAEQKKKGSMEAGVQLVELIKLWYGAAGINELVQTKEFAREDFFGELGYQTEIRENGTGS